ncbi:Lrp/AsnC family transcriptional regulator, partial [Terribacillus saccharophilus]|nr:winged helix-turn-helix transcriptional regulator [Terribacillus saccharophilus]
MDHIDRTLLELLQHDGRITISELSKKLALSRPSVSERMARLEERGVIE